MKFAVFLALLLLLPAAFANEDSKEKIRQELGKVLPITAVEYVESIGLYQVMLSDGTYLFTNESADAFIAGELYEVEDDRPVNVTERVRNAERFEMVQAIDEGDMIIYPAKKEKIGTAYVFTDIDCGFCRRLHTELGLYNQAGVEVRYISWPRCGLECPSYDKAVAVWCAQDQHQAMNVAKSGGQNPQASCDNPVANQYMLGVRLGLRGTPFIVLSNGTSVPGYRPAVDIIQLLAKS